MTAVGDALTRTFLADQYAGAREHVTRAMYEHVAEMSGTTRSPGAYVNRLRARIASLYDEEKYCGHLASAPGPTFFFASAPDLLHCQACAGAAYPTIADIRPCAACGRDDIPLPETLCTLGAVVLVYAICRPCFDGEAVL